MTELIISIMLFDFACEKMLFSEQPSSPAAHVRGSEAPTYLVRSLAIRCTLGLKFVTRSLRRLTVEIKTPYWPLSGRASSTNFEARPRGRLQDDTMPSLQQSLVEQQLKVALCAE